MLQNDKNLVKYQVSIFAAEFVPSTHWKMLQRYAPKVIDHKFC